GINSHISEVNRTGETMDALARQVAVSLVGDLQRRGVADNQIGKRRRSRGVLLRYAKHPHR
ncbi:MAG: hypothetical protein U0L21_01980, partial [Alistipes sp.]|nr:hypothetical protein [Alistipes sp.]